MTRDEIKQGVLGAVDGRAEDIIVLLRGHGEEHDSSREALEGLGFSYGDIAWRVERARRGALEFLGGKPERLRLGHLDDEGHLAFRRGLPRRGTFSG
jgi:hypothetical protein